MRKYWNEYSIGELMKKPETAQAILDAVKGDEFLTNYFKTFGQNAKHSFAEVEGGSQMAGSISLERMKNIKEALLLIEEKYK